MSNDAVGLVQKQLPEHAKTSISVPSQSFGWD
jgi:hypothetical protein